MFVIFILALQASMTSRGPEVHQELLSLLSHYFVLSILVNLLQIQADDIIASTCVLLHSPIMIHSVIFFSVNIHRKITSARHYASVLWIQR